MRTTFKTTWVALALLLALSSCQNLETDVQPPETTSPQKELREVIITASISDAQDETRTSYNETEGKNYWSPGDKIKVFSAGEEAEFTSMNTSPEPIVKFKGYIASITGSSNDDDDSKDYVWGLYPYSTGATYAEPDGISRTAQITVTYPDVQVGVAGTFGDNLAVMIGRSESLAIPFRGAYSGAFFKVNRDDIVSMTLEGLNGEVLAGTATIGLDNSQLPVVYDVADPKTAVTVTAPHGTFEPGANYYIITLPDVALPNGYKVTLRRADGYQGTYELRANRPLNRIRFRNLSDPIDVRIESAANISAGTSTGWVQSTTQGINEIWYTTSDGQPVTYTVDSSTGNEVDEIIAPTGNDGTGIIRFKAPITEIDDEAFTGSSNLTGVTLPQTVEYIGYNSFFNCVNLTTVNLGNGLKRIEEGAFYDCTLLSEIDLPEGLEWIGGDAFANCALTEVTIPSTVEWLGYGKTGVYLGSPFIACQSLQSFSGKYASEDGRCLIVDGNLIAFASGGMEGETYSIPDGTIRIHPWAFYGATISHVVFPSSVTSINQYAFTSAELKDLTIPATVSSVYQFAFSYCRQLEWVKILKAGTVLSTDTGHVFDDTNDCPIYVPAVRLKHYKNEQFWDAYEARYQPLPEDNKIFYTTTDGEAVTYTVSDDTGNELVASGCKAPKDNNGIGIIQFSAPITKVDAEALSEEVRLVSVTLPDTVEEIGEGAFSSCENLADVHLGVNLKHIYPDAFAYTAISSIDFPEGLESIDYLSFEGCDNLQEVRIPDSVRYLGFYGNTFSGNPFFMCRNLTSFSGKFATEDGKCLVFTSGALVSLAPSGMNGQTYTLPSEVTRISAFSMAYSTLKKAILPSGVTRINRYAFYASIIENVTIPESVQFINENAFANCDNLSTIRMESATPPTLGANVFFNTPADMEIEIPGAGYTAYTTGNGWADYRTQMVVYQSNREIWYHNDAIYDTDNYDWNFGAEYSGTNELVKTHLVKGVKMNIEAPASLGEEPQFRVMVFNGTVTSVGDYCFGDDGNYHEPALHVDFVSLPPSITSIGKGAFYKNTKLKNYPAHNSRMITSIGDDAFNGCSSMTGYNVSWIPGSESSIYVGYYDVAIGARAFKGCSGIENFAANVNVMGEAAFKNCTGLKTVIGLRNMSAIPDSAFYACQNLEKISRGDSHDMLTTIGKAAFYNCRSLNKIYCYADGEIEGAVNFLAVTSVGNSAFRGCKSMTAFNAPELATIDEYGFYDCWNMQSITVPSLENVKMYGLGNCYSLSSLNLPAIKSLSNRAMAYPRDLAELHLGPNLEFIGDELFYTLNNQTVSGVSVPINQNKLELYFEGTTVTSTRPSIQNKAFDYQTDRSSIAATYYVPFKFKKIYVPSSKLEDYKAKLRTYTGNSSTYYNYGDEGFVEGY